MELRRRLPSKSSNTICTTSRTSRCCSIQSSYSKLPESFCLESWRDEPGRSMGRHYERNSERHQTLAVLCPCCARTLGSLSWGNTEGIDKERVATGPNSVSNFCRNL